MLARGTTGLPESQTPVPKHGGLDAALRRARDMEAAHYDAVLTFREAELLRLEALLAELAPVVASHDRARDYFDLAIAPGEPPRLWIDLVGSVLMAPDPRTYRLVQDLPAGRAVVCETTDRTAMVEAVTQYMAHRLVARERQVLSSVPMAPAKSGHSGLTVFLAWLAGTMAGALALALVLIVLKKLN